MHFSFPEVADAASYTVEIAQGDHKSEASFKKAILVRATSAQNSVIAEVPFWKADYTWRAVAHKGKVSTPGSLHHFSTFLTLRHDSLTRMHVTTPAKAFSDGYFFVDATAGLYDMSGNLVWYMPDDSGVLSEVRDLRFTPSGTITYLRSGRFFEVNYDFEIIREIQGVSVGGDLHHEGFKMPNGHYFVLANERISWKQTDTGVVLKYGPVEEPGFRGGPFGVVNEFDEKGNLLWQGHFASYFLPKAAGLREAHLPMQAPASAPHLNALYFDAEGSYVYAGFRNASTILKMSYPSGEIVAVYKGLPMGNLDSVVFCEQHAVKVKNGEIYLFNNNGCNTTPIPKVQIMTEAKNAAGVDLIWEFQPANKVVAGTRNGGGNVEALSDGTVFFSLGSPYSGAYLVNRGKDILWCVKMEMRSGSASNWEELPNYRASFVENKKALEFIVSGRKSQ